MSKSSPSVRATLRTRPASRLTPSDMLPDWTIRASDPRLAQAREILLGEARRAHDVDEAGGGREPGEARAHSGRREVDDAVGALEGDLHVARDGHVEPAAACQQPGILA